MDESVINGANLFFAPQFGINPRGGTDQENSRNQWLLGLVNSAPYVGFICQSSAIIIHVKLIAVLRCARLLADRTGLCFYDGLGYSRAHPCFCFQLNRLAGRRGTIFITALFSFLTCVWQGVTNSWPHLFVARFVLGLGIGPKSSTVPVYAAECQSSFICKNCC